MIYITYFCEKMGRLCFIVCIFLKRLFAIITVHIGRLHKHLIMQFFTVRPTSYIIVVPMCALCLLSWRGILSYIVAKKEVVFCFIVL